MLPASGKAAVGSSRTKFTVFRLQSARPFGAADGDVESNSRLAEDALTFLKRIGAEAENSKQAPIHGVVASLSSSWTRTKAVGFENPDRRSVASTAFYCNKGLTSGSSGEAPEPYPKHFDAQGLATQKWEEKQCAASVTLASGGTVRSDLD